MYCVNVLVHVNVNVPVHELSLCWLGFGGLDVNPRFGWQLPVFPAQPLKTTHHAPKLLQGSSPVARY